MRMPTTDTRGACGVSIESITNQSSSRSPSRCAAAAAAAAPATSAAPLQPKTIAKTIQSDASRGCKARCGKKSCTHYTKHSALSLLWYTIRYMSRYHARASCPHDIDTINCHCVMGHLCQRACTSQIALRAFPSGVLAPQKMEPSARSSKKNRAACSQLCRGSLRGKASKHPLDLRALTPIARSGAGLDRLRFPQLLVSVSVWPLACCQPRRNARHRSPARQPRVS